VRSLEGLLSKLTAAERAGVGAMSVTSTSGTTLLLDDDGVPLRPAIMWDDKRAVAESEAANDVLRPVCLRNGYRFRPTFSLPKALWVRHHEPEVWERLAVLSHAADWLNAQLIGRSRPLTEPTNALKSGYDLVEDRWPEELATLGVAPAALPEVATSGEVIGHLRPDLAARLGLPPEVPVAIGMTDANTALVSSGAVAPGAWTTGISTGLSVKGVSTTHIFDAHGALYCHRHPEMGWIPSCTMHTGGDALTERFGNDRLGELDAKAAAHGPATVLSFPLQRRGEYFPIYAPEAEGFTIGSPEDETDAYRSCLEGVAIIEGLAYEACARLGASVEGQVVTTGGGSRSRSWSQIRADVLGRPVCRPVNEGTAIGAAIVALAACSEGLQAATQRAVRHTDLVEPDAGMAGYYHERRAELLEAFSARGYPLATAALPPFAGDPRP
jgi:sugar (pentulose or hexulose) kinase